MGRYGTRGYNYHAQQFEGEEWPQELGETGPSQCRLLSSSALLHVAFQSAQPA